MDLRELFPVVLYGVAIIAAIMLVVAIVILSVWALMYVIFVKLPVSEILYALETLWRRHGRNYASGIVAGAWWLLRLIFYVLLFIVTLPYTGPRALWSWWQNRRRTRALAFGMGMPQPNRFIRIASWVWQRVKRGFLYATQDVWHAIIILAVPILLVFLVRFFVQWESEQEIWRQVLANPWDSLWFWIALISFLLLGIAFLRKHPDPTPRFLKILLGIVLIVDLLLMFSPFLYLMAEKGIQQMSDHPLVIHPFGIGEPSQTPPQNAPTPAPDVFTPGIMQRDGKVYATLTGREEKGLTVLLMPPGSTYQVCWVQGKITSFQPFNGNNDPEPLWGEGDGYIRANAQHVAVDWRPNFRYFWVRGVLPYATLLIVGTVGSGQERVIPFPESRFCADASNGSKELQPLVLYFHALQFYWWQEGDNYAFPTQASAASFGRTNPKKYDGWQDQGKDGSTETFVVVPIP